MIHPEQIYIKEYTYFLPQDRIASFPLSKRDHSKLLIYHPKEGIKEDFFYNVSHFLPPGSSVILNDTKVIEARILFNKLSGGVIEIFCLEPFNESIETALNKTRVVQWKCLIGGASKWKHGQVLEKKLIINDELVTLQAQYISKEPDSFVVSLSWEPGHYHFSEVIHYAGSIPLPPYIKRDVTSDDSERYQTIFSKYEGSVAAPTAALHFSQKVFEDLIKKSISISYITLHVGAGTFKPVKSMSIDGHEMHAEPFMVTFETIKNLLKEPIVIAVGTTSMRTIETIYWLGVKLIAGIMNDKWSLSQWEAYELADQYPGVSVSESLHALINQMNENNTAHIYCQTSLMIVPGYPFKIVNGLITNFHQPQSTLLLLVSAFIGEDWKRVYSYALENNFRFLSYGDSSLLWRK